MSSAVIEGNNVVVTLFGIPDNKRITVRLTNVNNSGVDVAAALGFLIGDVNSSRTVTSADSAAIKARAGQTAVAGTGVFDLNASGFITASDIATAKVRNTRALPPAYTLGGAVNGLVGSLVLQNNGAGALRISANGSFTFPVAANGGYNVTIATQPAGQICTVTNGVGMIPGASVSNVVVNCNSAQPATIYSIKTGMVMPGSLVQLPGALVTGVIPGVGCFLQIKPGDPSYDGGFGANYSGIFVSASALPPMLIRGNRVDVLGTVTPTSGTTQVAASSITVSSGAIEALPAPVAVANVADVATGGMRAAQLESVRVLVGPTTVTAVNGMTIEFTLGGSLTVGNALYTVNPLPMVGKGYQSVTGIAATQANVSKLLPQSAADLVDPVPATFGPSGNYIRVGDMSVATFPAVLTVNLGTPAAANTFVGITTSSMNLQVVGGGVTIMAGSTSAPVQLTGLAQDAGVTLTASLPSGQLTATVRVLGITESPTLVSLTAPSMTIPVNGTATFTVNLDIPAPAMGTTVSLSLTPAMAGSIPATVTVPANQTSATFDYVDSGVATSIQVSASLAMVTLNTSLNMVAPGALVINEVDYDNVSTDTAEFIELYNGTGGTVDLSNLAVHLVNGSNNTTYTTIDLAPAMSLAPGEYLVIGTMSVQAVLPPNTKFIAFAVSQDNIQNGAPDGIALVNTSTLTVLDSFSYEGPITAAVLPGFANPVNLVRGTALPASVADSNTTNGSLCRQPNGARTNNDISDWIFCTTPTPGAANLP
jgi:hypothetical protein